MSKQNNIYKNIEMNTQKTCAVKGCTKNRHSLSRYCSTHQHHYYGFGHPLAYKVTPKDIEVEKDMATDIINRNESHEGIQRGLEILDKLLLECAQGVSFAPYSDYLAILHYQGVTAKEILATLSALYILQDGQSRLIKSDRHLTFLLGHFVLRMAKQASRVYGSHRKAIGMYLQDHLGSLCLNISKAAQERALKRDEALLQMTKPLSIE